MPTLERAASDTTHTADEVPGLDEPLGSAASGPSPDQDHDGRSQAALPAPGRAVPPWALFVLGLAVLAWSLVANWVIGDPGYTARNLLLTITLLVVARGAGLAPAELGLERDRVYDGLRWGGGAAAVIAVVLVAGVLLADALPGVATLLDDERAQLEGSALVSAALVRIPVGTAAFEETLFRGVLLAVFLRGTSLGRAALGTSALFGLWHVAPTAVSLELNGVVASSPEGIAAIAGAVAVTTVAGLGFTWLKVRSGSLLAPVLAHWATNAFGLLAAAASRALS
ncbi:MAG: CPBP family intramembrane glutamic endopeptidase [Nitriliruptoraceae bacterium]